MNRGGYLRVRADGRIQYGWDGGGTWGEKGAGGGLTVSQEAAVDGDVEGGGHLADRGLRAEGGALVLGDAGNDRQWQRSVDGALPLTEHACNNKRLWIGEVGVRDSWMWP